MSISKAEIEKLAKLGRLRFSDEELERFTGEFDEIIAFADTINQSITGSTDEIRNISSRSIAFDELREDSVIPSLPSERITSNVTDADGFFGVKRFGQKSSSGS